MKGSFSERYGYQKKRILSPEDMPSELRNRLWNIIKQVIESYPNSQKEWMIEEIWDEFFKKDLDEIKISVVFPLSFAFNKIKDLFLLLEWYKVYDFIEFLLQKMKIKEDIYLPSSKEKISICEGFINEINRIFEEEGAPYKIIDCCVTPITSQLEIEEIERALKIGDKYYPVKKHLSKGIELFSKRPNPDYLNSIKEAISAVEALTRIITGKENATLGEVINSLNIHPALKEAVKKLYGWASDEGGIRHAEKSISSQINQEEACFALVICSSIVNYIISKYGANFHKNTESFSTTSEFRMHLKNLKERFNKIII